MVEVTPEVQEQLLMDMINNINEQQTALNNSIEAQRKLISRHKETINDAKQQLSAVDQDLRNSINDLIENRSDLKLDMSKLDKSNTPVKEKQEIVANLCREMGVNRLVDNSVIEIFQQQIALHRAKQDLKQAKTKREALKAEVGTLETLAQTTVDQTVADVRHINEQLEQHIKGAWKITKLLAKLPYKSIFKDVNNYREIVKLQADTKQSLDGIELLSKTMRGAMDIHKAVCAALDNITIGKSFKEGVAPKTDIKQSAIKGFRNLARATPLFKKKQTNSQLVAQAITAAKTNLAEKKQALQAKQKDKPAPTDRSGKQKMF